MSLRSAAFSASRWTSVSTVLATALQMLQTILLARLLMPADFGLMAVAGTVIGVLLLVADLGFSQALIHFDDVPQTDRSSLYWLNMLVAIILMLALMAISPLFGRWYDSPELADLLCWVGWVFPLSAAGRQLRALAARDLNFGLLAINDITAAAAGLTTAAFSALLGAGVYALVAGMLVKALADSLLAWWRLPKEYWPNLHFRVAETRRYLSYGSYLAGESLLNALHRDADVFLGALVVGADRIGLYSVPRELALRGSMLLNSVVTKVGFPVMSRLKDQPERLRSIYLETLRMTASINFPVYVALGLFASEIVNLLYGPQWRESSRYLQVLAAWGLVRSVGNPVGSLIYATGQTKRAFYWNLALLLLAPPLLLLGARTGNLMGLALTAFVMQLGVVLPAWYFLVRPGCDASLREYFAQLAPPLGCALSAGVLAWLTAHNLPHGTLRLTVGCVVGGLTYLLPSWYFNRRWILAMLELLNLQPPQSRQKP